MRVIRYANTAVKNGVVAPTAWLNETARYRSEMFPPTTDKQKMKPRDDILRNWTRDLMLCMGTTLIHEMAT